MIEQAQAFLERYREDEALRARVREAEESYPGSLEVRESVVENVLLPIAAELGYAFTLEELRKLETRRKLNSVQPDVPIEEGEEIDDDQEPYWLLDRGWTYAYPEEALKG